VRRDRSVRAETPEWMTLSATSSRLEASRVWRRSNLVRTSVEGARLVGVVHTKIDVVAAIIERDGRFLIGKRSAHKRSAPGYWCPISGRIEAGESHAEAVVREVYEETGLRVEAIEKVAECDTHDQSSVIHWWRVRPLSDAAARLANDEHSELAWVTPDEMRRLEPVFLEDVAILEQAIVSARAIDHDSARMAP
jgi:8-oxo-dGTP pyrophosphatase MutT (NUDIX family)